MSKLANCIVITLALSGCGSIQTAPHNPSTDIIAWGDQSLAKDVAFSLLLLDSSNGATHWHITADEFDDIAKKCHNNPQCLRSIFVAFRSVRHDKLSRIPEAIHSDDAWFFERIVRHSLNIDGQSRKAVMLLLVASMCDKSEWVNGLCWGNVEERWESAFEWIYEYRFVLAYDCEKQAFSIDTKAQESNMRVSPRMQMWTRCQDL